MPAPEVDVSGREVGNAFVISQMIVMADEVSDLLFKIAWQIIIFEQDAVFESLVPAFDFALGLGMHRGTSCVLHAFS